MQVQKWLNKSVCVVAEGETQLEVFKNLASMQEVFGEEKCGKCGGEDFRYRVRVVPDGKKSYEYPELVCMNRECRARLSYGQAEGGVLFPVRYQRKDGAYVEVDGRRVKKGDWGWCRWNNSTGQEE